MSPGFAAVVIFVGVLTTVTAMLFVAPSAEKFGRNWPSASSKADCFGVGLASSPFDVIGQSSMALRLRFWAALTFRKRLRGFRTLMTDWATGRPGEAPDVVRWRDEDEADGGGIETADEWLPMLLLLLLKLVEDDVPAAAARVVLILMVLLLVELEADISAHSAPV